MRFLLIFLRIFLLCIFYKKFNIQYLFIKKKNVYKIIWLRSILLYIAKFTNSSAKGTYVKQLFMNADKLISMLSSDDLPNINALY